MPDHLFDELDRDEIDLWEDDSVIGVRDALRGWLGTAPSPLQERVAQNKVEGLRGLAETQGLKISTSRVREGRQNVERTVLRDARGRFVARGARGVRRFLEEESSF